MIKNLFIFFVKIYQNTIGLVLPPSCRFTPTCSEYTINSLKKYGAIKGAWWGIKRISKCHPYSKHSGWDPVK